jgi:hypothetical protein
MYVTEWLVIGSLFNDAVIKSYCVSSNDRMTVNWKRNMEGYGRGLI